MKASMYFNYTSRSLFRGGQRTLLAIFCIAVGVMAIVALELVGLMINNALTTNVRAANGGDIAINASSQPFKQSDLATFDQFKRNGTIVNYAALIDTNGSTSLSGSLRQTFSVEAVDPAVYPLVDTIQVTDPANGNSANLLGDGKVIITQSFADQYNKKVGDSLVVRAGGATQPGRKIPVKIAGIASETGVLAQAGAAMLVSQADYNAASPKAPVTYGTVDVTTSSKSQTDNAVKAIQNKFPLVSTQTADDALKSQQGLVDNIKKFLEIAGLLALLIGGVGIVNTMQVLLSRRTIEIAMLKTNGYRRTDLYLLFGLEAGMLGLIGGALGAGAATGVSYLVRNLVQQTFGLNIPFLLDPTTILGGVLIGLLTSLIFGLLPIVQAANIRPLNVIRELPEGNRTGSIALTIGMLIILSVLFCALAIFILNNDVTLGLISVYGTFIFLGLLSLFFGLVVFIISILPVPERFSAGYLALVITATVLSGLLCLILPAFGALLLFVSLMGFVIVLLPRTWKATTKMALRNIGRQRARTTTTMLALFVGIFTIGLILVLGQNLRDTVNNAISKSLDFNVIALMSSANGDKLQSQLSTIPGLKASRHTQITSAAPVAIDGKPIQTLLPKSGSPGAGTLGREGALQFLRGVEGYDVGNNQLPDPSKLPIQAGGRSLTANDAGTNNILAPSLLATLGPLHLKLNDTITLVSVDGKTIKTLTIVGFYKTGGFNTDNFEPLIGSADLAKSLSPAGLGQSAFYMKLDTAQVSKGVEKIGNIVPDAFVLNLANITNIIDQILNDVLLTLTTIASLSLLAGVIIIANAVALAMLERRRELGILKSVGYTSGSILSEVLIENGVIGGTGALLAMLLVTLATTILAQYVFKIPLNAAWEIALALIIGSAILAMLTSILVAWAAVRVRPLEVLRYE